MIGGAVDVWGPKVLGARSAIVQVARTLTQTSMLTEVTDPKTGHVYRFVAVDRVTPELRECGQYLNGTWFVLGGDGNVVRVGSILPESVGVSTVGYNFPNNLNDTANTGAQIRWMHGAMENPWQGVAAASGAPTGFDSFYAASNPGGSVAYVHDKNIDPGRTGQPYESVEATIVKCDSLLTEGTHGSGNDEKTRILQFSTLTIVREIPAEGSFRPPVRGTDKRSYRVDQHGVKHYWTLEDLDIAGFRTNLIADLEPYTQAQIDAAADRIEYVQQTFAPFQEQARRINPGARGGGVDIYGDDWYGQFSRCFASFHGAPYSDADLTPIIIGTVQVGVDLFGLMEDGAYMHPWQAHHAGRKGIAVMAGVLLNSPEILAQCRASDHPEHFGVDDAYCGTVLESMVGVQPRYYKGAHPYKWETEHIGLKEWSAVFPLMNTTAIGVATQDQVVDSDFPRRSYQVLSFDNGAMYQCLWGMLVDPTAQYYKSDYFDFADRYLAVRFGDQLAAPDGKRWDASSNVGGTNGHFTGNWHSINPQDAAVGWMKLMRDACPRRNHVLDMRPEPLPAPRVTHVNATDPYMVVDYNVNNFQCPHNDDVPITRRDVRWTAYAGNAETATGIDDPDYVGGFDWVYENDVSIPFNLTGIPRNTLIKVQIRHENLNGPGPWMDCRFRENFVDDVTVFSALSGTPRYSTNVRVPDLSEFDAVPKNYGPPRVSPSEAITVGATATATEGTWTDYPAADSTEFKWQESTDLVTWSDVPGSTTNQITAPAGLDGGFIRPLSRKTNSIGASDWAAGSAIPVVAPVAIELAADDFGLSSYAPLAGPLGGKRMLVMLTAYSNDVIPETGTVGAYSFGTNEVVYADNAVGGGQTRFRQVYWVIEVPSGEVAEVVNFGYVHDSRCGVSYELTQPLQIVDWDDNSSSETLTVSTVSGGAAFWSGRQGALVFGGSPTLVEHQSNGVTSTNFLAAFDPGTGDGTATVSHSSGNVAATVVSLISLGPVP